MLSNVFHTWHNIMKELEASQLSRPTVACEWFLRPGAALMCKHHKVQGEHKAGRESGVSPRGRAPCSSAPSSDLWVLPQGRIPVSPHAQSSTGTWEGSPRGVLGTGRLSQAFQSSWCVNLADVLRGSDLCLCRAEEVQEETDELSDCPLHFSRNKHKVSAKS